MLAVACVHRPDDADQIIASFATAEDRRACERYSRSSRRRQSLTSRALLRALLGRLFGPAAQPWTIYYNSDNKPFVTAATGREPVQVSMAHSRELVACAVTDIGPIGIDVEYCAPRPRMKGIAASSFGNAEQAAVDQQGAAAFYRIWTLREAMAKATGLGLFDTAGRSDLFAAAPAGKAWSTTLEGRRWTFFYQRLLRRYAFSVALKWGPE
jgi:4'-phosphopantetheinyl transferase